MQDFTVFSTKKKLKLTTKTNILSREQYGLKARGQCISASRRVSAPGLDQLSLWELWGFFSSLLCPVSKIDTFHECAGKEQHVMGLVMRRSQNTYQLLYLFTSSKKAPFRGTCLLACNQTLCALPRSLKIDLHMLCSSESLLACPCEMSLLVGVAGRGCSLPLDAGTARGSHACLQERLCPLHPGSPSATKRALLSLKKKKKWSIQVPVFSTCSSPGNGHNSTFLYYLELGISLCWRGGKAQ